MPIPTKFAYRSDAPVIAAAAALADQLCRATWSGEPVGRGAP